MNRLFDIKKFLKDYDIKPSLLTNTAEEIAEIMSVDENEFLAYRKTEEYKDAFNTDNCSLGHSAAIVNGLKAIRLEFNEIKNLYYPCSASDISPSMALKDCNIIYSDLNKHAMDLLVSNGFAACRENAAEFKPKGIDTILLLNPTLGPVLFSDIIGSSGIIICNNYHATAKHIFKGGDFIFAGRIGLVGNDVISVTIDRNGIPENNILKADDLYIFIKK